jgi:hypothetical protein
VRRFEAGLLDFMRTRHSDMLTSIKSTGGLPEGDALAKAVTDFKASFEPSDAEAGGAGSPVGESVGPETTPETLETE